MIMISTLRIAGSRIYTLNRLYPSHFAFRCLNFHQNNVMLASKTTDTKEDLLNMTNSRVLSNLPVPVKPSIFDSIKEKFGMQGSYR